MLALVPVVLAASALLQPHGALQAGEAKVGRVIVLVPVGMEDVRSRITAGELSHLKALIEKGGVSAGSTPAVPTDEIGMWTALATGQGMGHTAIPGYVGRSLEGAPLPAFGYMEQESVSLREVDAEALGVEREWLPASYSRFSNLLETPAFWNVAAQAGVKGSILRMGMTFGQPSESGANVLYGEGMMDCGGNLGHWAVYTDDRDEFDDEGRNTSTAGTIFRVREQDSTGGTSRFESTLYGPPNFWRREKLERRIEEIDDELESSSLDWSSAPAMVEESKELKKELAEIPRRVGVELEIERREGLADVRIDGVGQTLSEGEWSAPYHLSFAINEKLDIRGVVRVKVVSLADPFRLYVDTIDVDPTQPSFWNPLSSPPEFAAELAKECGAFDTFGWGASATMGYKDGEVEIETLLEDLEITFANAEALTHAALRRQGERLLVSCFTMPDRLQHMIGQFVDPDHPLYDETEAKREVEFFGRRVALRDLVGAAYREMDRVIGDVAAKLAPEDTLLVYSPFGLQPAGRQVDLNVWLAENGYMGLKSGKQRHIAFTGTDWARTEAYSLGLGLIYLNREGREPEGIVAESECEAKARELRDKLLAAVDPETGSRWCASVTLASDLPGPYSDAIPDLVVGFAPGYRVGWKNSSGSLGMYRGELQPVVTENRSPWSGSHETVAPEAIPGFFYCSRELEGDFGASARVHALQVAPTILGLLGVEVPAAMEREGLRLRAR